MIQKTLTGLFLAWLSLALPVYGQQAGQPDDEQPDTAEPAQPEETEPAPERHSISSGLDEEVIAERWPGQAVWLDLEDDRPALALLTPEQITPSRGAMVILADEGGTAAGGFAGALSEPMAKRGWAVMTVGLAPLPLSVEQARRQAGLADSPGDSEDQGDNQASPTNPDEDSVMIDVIEEESVDSLEQAYLDRVRKTVSAAVQQVRDGGYDRVVLAGVGRAAEHVTRFAVESGGVDAVVWVAADFSVVAEPVAELLDAKGPWPLLDLHNTDGDQERAARQRQAALARAGITGYQRKPVVLGQPPHPGQASGVASYLAARLSGN